MILNQNKKRRRRKKKAEPHHQNQLSVPTLPSSTKFPNPTAGFTKPKLKKSYLKEENDVKSALLLRNNGKSEDLEDVEKKEKNDFFTDSISVEKFNDVIKPSNDDNEILCASGGGEKLLQSSRRTTSPISSIDKAITEPGDGQQLASSYIQVEDDNVIEQWEKQQIKPCENLLFYPQTNLTNLSDSIGALVRNLEDEGLFVWSKPNVCKNNENKMINRFLEDGSESWIQKMNGVPELIDQRIFSEPSVLIKTQSTKEFRPVLFEQRHVDQVIGGHTSSTSVPDNLMTLKIHISELIFERIASAKREEHELARQVELLYKQYLDRRNGNVVERLEKKLITLRQILASKFNDNEKVPAENLHQFKFDRRDIRNQLHRERQMDREILRSILEQWTELKEVRKKQGFNSTAPKLVIKIEKVDEIKDLEKWEATFAMELNEILEETIEYYNKKRREQKASTKKDLPIKAKPNPDEIEERLHEIFSKSMRNPGEPIIFLELHKIPVASTNSAATETESTIRYSIQIVIDREKVTSVKSAPLIRVGAVDKVYINGLFTITLTKSMPKNVQLLVSIHLHSV